jgi:hypothetical protein
MNATIRVALPCALALSFAVGFAAVQYASAADDAPELRLADFEHQRTSHDVRYLADWVVHSSDNHTGDDRSLPFVIIDKKGARVYVFDASGRLRGQTFALLGRGLGDTALPGIGARELSAIAPKDRVTPAGRFVSRLGVDTHGEDVLWLDYDGGLAMHRVITTNPKERRLHRLSTKTIPDKRISYGCINLPVRFYEDIVQPAFKGSRGIVYVLPETKRPDQVFASYDVHEHLRRLRQLNSTSD